MQHSKLFDTLTLARGPALMNRLMLAPLTNQQSHADGCVSESDLRWLTMRAKAGFGLILTAAATVQSVGQGYPGQLGIHSDHHIDGLSRLAGVLRANGSCCAVQLFHAGDRASRDLVGTPVSPTGDSRNGARELNLDEVEQLQRDFVLAALRAEKAGFDGVEIHGAHGYVLAQFLSPEINRRSDRYGGTLENRARLLIDVIDAIRSSCRPDFQMGLRLSPERFGMRLGEVRDVAAEVLRQGKIDYLDLSLWDVTKEPVDVNYQGRTLLSYFTELQRGNVRIGGAGKVMSAAVAERAIDAGCDFVAIGRAAILHHDFPERVRRNPGYQSPDQPVSTQHLRDEGVSHEFIAYLRNFPGLVSPVE